MIFAAGWCRNARSWRSSASAADGRAAGCGDDDVPGERSAYNNVFPTFTNLALLGGLAAIAAPILIHLLLKRKSQRMKFSTVQFFLKQDEQSMRKRKLRNLLLLATRVLLFALIVLAFARPFLPGGEAAPKAGGSAATGHFAGYVSASMQERVAGRMQWTRALRPREEGIGRIKNERSRGAGDLFHARGSGF